MANLVCSNEKIGFQLLTVYLTGHQICAMPPERQNEYMRLVY